ncbi:MAG: transposase [Cyclobacteriaceae bacterium]
MSAIEGLYPKRHLISVDEKTGIQALEHLEGRAPDSRSAYKRIEFEYVRHGTTCLMAATDVGKGRVAQYRLGAERKEPDFPAFIQATVACYPPTDEILILADQLNTRFSESLVRWAASRWLASVNGFEADLGKKGRKGILKNTQSRMAFLETSTHRVRFVYTPKHCSWLNPVENWFAKLQRHIIQKGNFSSVGDLIGKIEAYIDFHNRCLVKPLKWKFKGFSKAEELKNIKRTNT